LRRQGHPGLTPGENFSPQTSGHFPKDLPLPQMVIMLPRPLCSAWWTKWGFLPSDLSSRGWSLHLTSHVATPGSEPSRRLWPYHLTSHVSMRGPRVHAPSATRDWIDQSRTRVQPGARPGSRVLTRETFDQSRTPCPGPTSGEGKGQRSFTTNRGSPKNSRIV